MKTILLLAVLALCLSGCSGLSRMSAQEFQSQYQAGSNQTMKSASYLGQSDGKAYLSISSMSLLNQNQWSSKLYYVNLNELPTKFRDSLPEKEYVPVKQETQNR